MKTGFSLLIILILLPYVAVVFRTGSMKGQYGAWEEAGLEAYVYGILPGQMPVSYEKEALKAQALIIRTNLLREAIEYYEVCTASEAAERLQEGDLERLGFTYYTSERLAELLGTAHWEYHEKKIYEAVAETKGEYLTENGQLPDLPYHALSAGRTRAGTVLGEAYGYLESCECSQDRNSPEYLKIQSFPLENFMEGGEPIVPEIRSRDEAGYVLEVRMGSVVLSGEEFRGRYALNSSCFTLEEKENQLRIVTKGLGHGLGLSQYQANFMALEGSSYQEILAYFYKNVECISLS